MINFLSDPFSNYRQSNILRRNPTSSMMASSPSSSFGGSSISNPMDDQSQPDQPVIKNPFVRQPLFGPDAQQPATPDITRPSTYGMPTPPRFGMAGAMGPDPESPALEKYKSYLDTIPKRADYAPSALTRIGAALSGAATGWKDPSAGFKTAQDINNSGYKMALEDYANKGAGLKEAADIEGKEQDDLAKRQQLARQYGLDYDKLSQEQWKEIVAMNQKNRELDQGDLKNSIASRRADAYITNLGRGDYDKTPLADGTLLYTNKKDAKDTIRIDPKDFGGSATVDAGKLGVEQYAAQSGRIAAGAQATQANTGAQRFNWDVAGGYQKSPTALDQTHGSDLAMEHLSRDPDFGKFVAIDPVTKRYTVKQGMEKAPGYDVFLQALDSTSRAATDGSLFAPARKQMPTPPFSFSLGHSAGGR